jgi:pyruvate kinase
VHAYEEKVIKTLQLIRGVIPLEVKQTFSTDEMFREALRSGMVKNGDLVVITAGVPVNVTGTTNQIRVHVI